MSRPVSSPDRYRRSDDARFGAGVVTVATGASCAPASSPILDENSAQMSLRCVLPGPVLRNLPLARVDAGLDDVASGMKITGSLSVSGEMYFFASSFGVAYWFVSVSIALICGSCMKLSQAWDASGCGASCEDDPGVDPVERPVVRDDVLRVGRRRSLAQVRHATRPGQAEDGLLVPQRHLVGVRVEREEMRRPAEEQLSHLLELRAVLGVDRVAEGLQRAGEDVDLRVHRDDPSGVLLAEVEELLPGGDRLRDDLRPDGDPGRPPVLRQAVLVVRIPPLLLGTPR